MKTLTIIKAIGAGVTALYLGGKVAHLTQTTDSRTDVEDETAQQWSYAVDEFMKALEDIRADRAPESKGLNVDLTRRVKPSDLLDSLNEMLKREGNMP